MQVGLVLLLQRRQGILRFLRRAMMGFVRALMVGMTPDQHIGGVHRGIQVSMGVPQEVQKLAVKSGDGHPVFV